MDLNVLLEELLRKYKNIQLPGIGKLSLVNSTSNNFGPIQQELSFNPSELGNDGVLINYIAKTYDISYQAAEDMLHPMLQEIKQTLTSGRELKIGSLGTIQQSGESYTTHLANSNEIPSDFFGLGDLNENTSDNDFYSFQTKTEAPFIQIPTVEIPKRDIPTKKEKLKSNQNILETPSKPEAKIVVENETTAPTVIKSLDELGIEVPAPIVEVKEEETTIKELKIDSNPAKEIELEPIPTIEEENPTPETAEIEQANIDSIEETNISLANISSTSKEIEESITEKIKEAHQLENEILEQSAEKEITAAEDESMPEYNEEMFAFAEMKEKDSVLAQADGISEQQDEHTAVNTKASNIPFIETITNETYKKRLRRYDDDETLGSTSYSLDEEEKSENWGKVAGIIVSILIVGFMATWIWATLNCKKFIGLAPLWDTGCGKALAKNDTKIKSAPSDTASTMSGAMAADSVSKNTKGVNNTLPNSDNIQTSTNNPQNGLKTTSVLPSTPTASAKPANTNSPNANAAANSASSKPKVTSTPKSTSTNNSSNTASNNPAKATEDLSKEPNLAKNHSTDKPTKTENVKPAKGATAVYRKGNSYVCFGTFKNAATANQLRSDLRGAGVITETVYVDGTYRVVIPFLDRKYAEKSAQEFPNTIIFD